MYRVSLKQLAMLALASALITGVIVACVHRAVEKGNITVEPVVIADPTVATEEQNNIEVYRKISPGVVFITTRGYSEGLFGLYPSQGSGSGSIIDQEGHILTNYHVIQGAREVEVQIENDRYSAQIVGNDRDNDLAIIKIDAPRGRLTVVPLGASKGLQVGQKVLAIGYPFGLQRTLTTGIISGLERPLYDSAARRTIEGTIQTDASINPGNSGGPLLNAKGEMIGINTAIYSQSGGSIGIGFAVPVDIANKIIPEIIAKGYVSRPWLGASTFPLTRRIARAYSLPVTQGVIVGEVYRGSGAAAAGLRPAVVGQNFWGDPVLQQIGDVIVSVNGQAVANNEDIYKAIKDKRPGQTVDVEVLRGGRQVSVSVRLIERPPDTQ
ncbi:MAG: trypsin-like peptidase domain-containing protein [Acidobacteriota bacterium]